MIEEELVEEEPAEEGREDMADDHGRERQSIGRQSIVKGKGLSIGLLRFFFFFFNVCRVYCIYYYYYYF